jgi:hypothetical protein
MATFAPSAARRLAIAAPNAPARDLSGQPLTNPTYATGSAKRESRAGIVDKHIKSAEGLDDLFDGGFDGLIYLFLDFEVRS